MTTNEPQPSTSERDRNRELFPECAKFVADMRKVFGEITVAYASENGHVRGEKGPEGIVVQTPERKA